MDFVERRQTIAQLQIFAKAIVWNTQNRRVEEAAAFCKEVRLGLQVYVFESSRPFNFAMFRSTN